MKKWNRAEFLETVKNNEKGKDIKNGTEFEVFKEDESIGVVAVQRTSIVYHGMPNIPVDLLTNDIYSFNELADEEAE